LKDYLLKQVKKSRYKKQISIPIATLLSFTCCNNFILAESSIKSEKIKWDFIETKVEKKQVEFHSLNEKSKNKITSLDNPPKKTLKSKENASEGHKKQKELNIKWFVLLNDSSFEIVIPKSKFDRDIKLSNINHSGSNWHSNIDTEHNDKIENFKQNVSIPEIGIKTIIFSKDDPDQSISIHIDTIASLKLGPPKLIEDKKNIIIKFKNPINNLHLNLGNNYSPIKVVPKEIVSVKENTRADDKKFNPLKLSSKGFIKAKGPKISMIVKDSDPINLLMSISKIGSYGFIYIPSNDSEDKKNNNITISLENENYDVALNSILLASGWQGKIEGGVVLVGENVLNSSFGQEISHVYKMNHASASSAADYLASLGASIAKVKLSGAGTNNDSSYTPSQNQDKTIKSYGSAQGPLKGLIGTTDTRMETITLIGNKDLVFLATDYLNQIDVKQKQIALSVKILDVNVDNGSQFGNSFAGRVDDTYIVNDEGVMDLVFGKNLKAWETGRTTGVAALDLDIATKYDFLSWLKAKVNSSETRVLASPTIILSESKDSIDSGAKVVSVESGLTSSSIGRPFANETFLTVGSKVITNYDVTAGQNGASATCSAIFGTAGLTFGAKVHKVDSNDYVSFSLSPELSSTTGTQTIGTCGPVNLLSVRRLDTGTVRVKDKGTLILSGVLTDSEVDTIDKIPVLGDIPVLGNLFQKKSDSKKKSELIIMVTPTIINES
tara:strand:- start:12312 stop:14480 length:2169 start_codon:yes stop_codon:yes gene_type:complete